MTFLSLKWKEHNNTFFRVLSTLREEECLTDVYLGCDGLLFPAHQIVLTVCSDYFASILQTYKAKNPVIILNGINVKDLKSLLDYMYDGEISVEQCELATLVAAAELLQIKGLSRKEDSEQPLRTKRARSPAYSSSSKHIKMENMEDNLSEDFQRTGREGIDEIKEEKDYMDSHNDNHSVDDEWLTDESLNAAEKQKDESGLEEDCQQEYKSIYVDSEGRTSKKPPDLSDGESSRSTKNDKGSHQLIARKYSHEYNVYMYHCKLCGKVNRAFAKAKIHLRIHTGEKVCKCSVCNFRCNDPSSLRRHVRLKH